MQYLKSFPLWNVVLGGRESEGENESNTANQFTADNICYKLFLLCGRLTNSRWKRWRGRVSEALPMWQAISGLRVISVPYSRQLASHAWLLHARRSMPTAGFLFSFPRRSEISHLNSEVQRRKLIQRKKKLLRGFLFLSAFCAGPSVLIRKLWWGIFGCRHGKQDRLMLNRKSIFSALLPYLIVLIQKVIVHAIQWTTWLCVCV